MDLTQLPRQWSLTEAQAQEIIKKYMLDQYQADVTVNFKVGSRIEGYGTQERPVTSLHGVTITEIVLKTGGAM